MYKEILQLVSFTLGMVFIIAILKRETFLTKPRAFLLVASLLMVIFSLPDVYLFSSIKYILAAGVAFLAIISLILMFQPGKQRYLFNSDQIARNLVDNALNQYESRLRVKNKILVVIPAYNEAENIEAVIKSAPKSVFKHRVELVIVDDGSNDGTSDIANAAGAMVIKSPINRGGGYALQLGFQFCKLAKMPFIVTMDADGQHEFSDFKNILQPLIEKDFDIVIGSRTLGSTEMKDQARSFGISIFNHIISFLTGSRTTDCSNSYRGFTLEALTKLNLFELRHHTAELLIEAARKKVKVCEVPVHIKERNSGTSKKGSNLVYGLRFALSILTSWWRAAKH